MIFALIKEIRYVDISRLIHQLILLFYIYTLYKLLEVDGHALRRNNKPEIYLGLLGKEHTGRERKIQGVRDYVQELSFLVKSMWHVMILDQ